VLLKRYTNNPVEADHSRLKARLLKARLWSREVKAIGHADRRPAGERHAPPAGPDQQHAGASDPMARDIT
jgi:hypothetical protein